MRVSCAIVVTTQQVHDVMGLSLRDGASVFQLECDRSRARYGVILLAFRFDPPVAADVLGEFDGIGSAMVVSAAVLRYCATQQQKCFL